MELASAQIAVATVRTGTEKYVLSAGKKLIVRTKQPTVDQLDYEVPAGRQANVTISVTIKETDA